MRTLSYVLAVAVLVAAMAVSSDAAATVVPLPVKFVAHEGANLFLYPQEFEFVPTGVNRYALEYEDYTRFFKYTNMCFV